MKQTNTFNLTVTDTAARCPIGEVIGKRNAQENAIAVLSCEGACIRGEIARLAANRLAQEPGHRRGCHGELFAVPHSEMASWIRRADQVVVVDGCHLKCHARIVEHLVPRDRLRSFDALARYRKFNDLFDIDSVPEAERRAIADDVARWVLSRLRDRSGTTSDETGAPACACAGSAEPASGSGGDPAGGCDAPADRPRSQFTPQVQHLVAIGAAIAANCKPCLMHHVHEAERLGVSRADISHAVTLATRVKDAPHQQILAVAERLTGAAAQGSESAPDTSCCARGGAPEPDSAGSCAASG